MSKHIVKTPVDPKLIEKIRAGDIIYITGTIYTARDIAHKKLITLLNEDKDLPFPVKGSIIYYTGPTPTKPGHIIGSVGPTTSCRMDKYTPQLFEVGVSITIGKGSRSDNVVNAVKVFKGLYCVAYGGAGAFIASKVKKAYPVAFSELGPEAIRALEVEDFPVTVINDSQGNDWYKIIKESG